MMTLITAKMNRKRATENQATENTTALQHSQRWHTTVTACKFLNAASSYKYKIYSRAFSGRTETYVTTRYLFPKLSEALPPARPHPQPLRGGYTPFYFYIVAII